MGHFRRLTDPHQVVRQLCVLAAIRSSERNPDTVIGYAREALTLARQTGNPGLTSGALAVLAYVLADSEPERSRALIAESLELSNQLGVVVIDELALVLTITASAMLGERDQVLELSARGFDGGITGIIGLAPSLESSAEAMASESPAASAVIHGYLDAWSPHVSEREPHSRFRQRATAAIDAQLDAPRVIDLHAQGAAMTSDQITAFALAAITRVLQAKVE